MASQVPSINIRFNFQKEMNNMLTRSLGDMLPFFKELDWDNTSTDDWETIVSQMVCWGNPCGKGGVQDDKYQTFMTSTYGAKFRKSAGRAKVSKPDNPAEALLLKTCYHNKSFGRVKKLEMPGDIPFGLHVGAGKKSEKWLCWPVDDDAKMLTGQAFEAYGDAHFKTIDCEALGKAAIDLVNDEGKPICLNDSIPTAYWAYRHPNTAIGQMKPSKAQLKHYEFVAGTKSSKPKSSKTKQVRLAEPKSQTDTLSELLNEVDCDIVDPFPAAAIVIGRFMLRFTVKHSGFRELQAWKEREIGYEAIFKHAGHLYAAQKGRKGYAKLKVNADKAINAALESKHSMWFHYHTAATITSGEFTVYDGTKNFQKLTDYYKMPESAVYATADETKQYIMAAQGVIPNTFRKYFAEAAAKLAYRAETESESDLD
jgi:hypothetical protein